MKEVTSIIACFAVITLLVGLSYILYTNLDNNTSESVYEYYTKTTENSDDYINTEIVDEITEPIIVDNTIESIAEEIPNTSDNFNKLMSIFK